MRERNEPLPSKEESVVETNKRLEIISKLVPKLKEFSEAIILAGSVAYGRNYSVRKNSDIDLLILIGRGNVDRVFSSGLFELTPQREEARRYFEMGEVDHFSVKEILDGVEVQFHFWDKEAHFKAEIGDYVPRVYDIWNRESPSLNGYDFTGKERVVLLKNFEKANFGTIYDFPAFFIHEGHFVPRQIITNLTMAPEILFCNDERLYENIEKIWDNLIKRLVDECGREDNLFTEDIVNLFYRVWDFSPESKKLIEERIKEGLRKQGVLFEHGASN